MKLLGLLWCGVLWLRQIIFVLYVAIVTIVMASLAILFGLLKFPLSWRLIPAKTWSTLMRWGSTLILWLSVKVEGHENLLDEPCVYISKHQSSWETVMFHGLMHNICFVLKQELLNIPLFGQGLKAVDSIPIDRKQSLKSFKKVLVMGAERLKKGLSIVIFPEGTRVAVGAYPKFHRTAMMLAKSTGAPIILVAHNSGRFWPSRAGLIKPGVVRVVYSKAIMPNEMSIDELNIACHQWINNTVKQLDG